MVTYGTGLYHKRERNYFIYIVPVVLIILIAGGYGIFRFYKKSNQNAKSVTENKLSQSFGQLKSPAVATPAAKSVPISTIKTPTEPDHSKVAAATNLTDSNSEAALLISKATKLITNNPSKIIEARNILNDVLSMPLTNEQLSAIKAQMTSLSDQWLFSKTIYPEDKLCTTYIVQSGDHLTGIGGRNKVTPEFLEGINQLVSDRSLQIGQKLKVVKGPFHAKVYSSTFTMDIYLQDMYVKSFPVGLGKGGMETPTGLWVVKEGGKLVQPPWTDPVTNRRYQASDPDYPLGSRWVALEGISGNAVGRKGFAIHGTKEPQSIGTKSSQGCIRLHNGNAILVYDLMVPTYSQVQVVE